MINNRSSQFLRFLTVAALTLGLAACNTGGGSDTTSLAPIDPDPGTGTGVATLTWDMPIQRVDGSDLKPVEIAKYRVYHGTSPTNLKVVGQTKDGQTTTYQVTGLEAGKTHYFYVTTVDLNYAESAPSNSAKKTI